MEIKVVQVDFAFKVYRSGETAAHICIGDLGGMREGVVGGEEGDKEREERLNNNISTAVQTT